MSLVITPNSLGSLLRENRGWDEGRRVSWMMQIQGGFAKFETGCTLSLVNIDLIFGYIFWFPALPLHEYLRALGGVAVDGPVVVAVVVAHGDAEPSVICPHLRVE